MDITRDFNDLLYVAGGGSNNVVKSGTTGDLNLYDLVSLLDALALGRSTVDRHQDLKCVFLYDASWLVPRETNAVSHAREPNAWKRPRH